MIDVSHYSYRKDRPSRRGGGVMIYVKDTFKYAEVKLDIAGLECFVLNVIMSPKMNFNVVFYIIHPHMILPFFSNLEEL